MTQSGIYTIRNTVDGKVYVGQSRDIAKRWRNHATMLRCGRHHSARLQAAWDADRALAYTVVETVGDRRNLNAREQVWIDELKSADPELGYNLVAQVVQTFGSHTEASKSRISFWVQKANRLKPYTAFGYTATLAEWAAMFGLKLKAFRNKVAIEGADAEALLCRRAQSFCNEVAARRAKADASALRASRDQSRAAEREAAALAQATKKAHAKQETAARRAAKAAEHAAGVAAAAERRRLAREAQATMNCVASSVRELSKALLRVARAMAKPPARPRGFPKGSRSAEFRERMRQAQLGRVVTKQTCLRQREATYVKRGIAKYAAFGREAYLADWAEEYKVERRCLWNRVAKQGLSMEVALTTPGLKPLAVSQ